MGQLKSKTWIFNFNPAARGKEKEITFNDDGTIGVGRNNNEHNWRVRSGLLEMLNHEDRVFSRFAYDDAKGWFVHTNDPDTLSIKSQTIRPKPTASQ
jgi:hypothetical protein